MEKRYLRFGNLPAGGRSINFLKLSNSQNEDFTDLLNDGMIDRAFAEVPESALELGVSAFEMDKSGMPILSNLRLVKSLLLRLNEPIFEISGSIAGVGSDGEPLISDAKAEKKRRISREKLLDHVLTYLLRSFRSARYSADDDYGSDQIFSSFRDCKINKKTGEKRSIYEAPDDADWVRMPSVREYMFKGWTFSDPVSGFCDQGRS